MKEVNTWPKTRVNVLAETRRLLGERFHAIGSRDVSRLSDWFANISELSSGAYGTVYKACIRAWQADNRTPVREQACVQYVLSDVPHASGPNVIYLIVKVMKALEGQRLLNDVPYAGHLASFTDWIGGKNSVRETMMGRLLNLLVVHEITPHVPLIYESFHVLKPYRSAFAMELSHMSFTNFVTSKILKDATTADALQLLDVAVLQLCNGLLCAQKHYDFRHNDFHGHNAMVTFITNTTYNYKVGDKFYRIPNFGMCWKLIDFGMASSAVFDRHDIAHAAMHSAALSEAHTYFDLKDHAAELFDVLRLVTFAKSSVDDADFSAARIRALSGRLEEFVAMLRDISLSSPEKRGSLLAAQEEFEENNYHAEQTGKLLRTSHAFSKLMRSSGLLEVFFARLGAKYVVSEADVPRGAVLFDASTSPFNADNKIELEGIVHDVPSISVSAPRDARAAMSASPVPARIQYLKYIPNQSMFNTLARIPTTDIIVGFWRDLKTEKEFPVSPHWLANTLQAPFIEFLDGLDVKNEYDRTKHSEVDKLKQWMETNSGVAADPLAILQYLCKIQLFKVQTDSDPFSPALVWPATHSALLIRFGVSDEYTKAIPEDLLFGHARPPLQQQQPQK